jgi:hypothetical protein
MDRRTFFAMTVGALAFAAWPKRRTVSSRFLRDFQRFEAAIKNAELQLRSWQTSTGAVERSLASMREAFSERQRIQEAAIRLEAACRSL